MVTSKTIDYQPTVYIETHGCKLNQADSSLLARDFIGAGYKMADPEQLVDVYILNSCTVTHVADRKARRALRAAKRRYPEAIIVAAGCYSERVPEELESMDAVDLIFGNRDKHSLVSSKHNSKLLQLLENLLFYYSNSENIPVSVVVLGNILLSVSHHLVIFF